MLAYNISFSSSHAQVAWHGKHVTDLEAFRNYVRQEACQVLHDELQNASFETDMRALATTGVATQTIESILSPETEVEKQDWEVGEALAQCLLTAEYGVRWPWNTERDKRTPKASLPGADLIGFVKIDGDVWLVLGEVKTSSDSDTPPGVMNGRSGMIHQLDALASNITIHRTLMKWLHARCKGTEFWPIFQEAMTRYFNSEGRAIKLFGLLMRDTSPNARDLQNRGRSLSDNVVSPTTLELCAWYLPFPISEWVSLTR